MSRVLSPLFFFAKQKQSEDMCESHSPLSGFFFPLLFSLLSVCISVVPNLYPSSLCSKFVEAVIIVLIMINVLTFILETDKEIAQGFLFFPSLPTCFPPSFHLLLTFLPSSSRHLLLFFSVLILFCRSYEGRVSTVLDLVELVTVILFTIEYMLRS